MPLPDPGDTIAAPATPSGSGAIGVVRLSGPGAWKAALSFLRTPSGAVPRPRPRTAARLEALDGGAPLDEVVAVFYKKPSSYTGQDMAEIFCHGSPYIMRRLLALAAKAGAREAEPGEFTLRAFLSGKMDLARSEAVDSLIRAENEAAHRAAITQVKGHLSARISALREKALALLSELEARLDDSYGDVAPLDLRRFRSSAEALSKDISALASGFEKGRFAEGGVRAVIAGRPNSGKSSLLNALAGYPRAIVSPAAGTTRDTVEERIQLGGFTLVLTDTAGLDPLASDPLEKEGNRRTLEALARADLALLALDGAARPGPAERRAAGAVRRALPEGARLIRVLTKSDLGRRREPGAVPVSSRTGAGIARLKARLRALTASDPAADRTGVVTSARHFSALSRAASEASALTGLLKPGSPPLELAAERLRGCLSELSGILGETAPEEVLAGIFSRFCVGK